MASSSTLSLCSSLASHCQISSSSHPPPLSLTQKPFPLLSSCSSSSPVPKTHFKLTSSAPFKPSSVAKFSDTEAPPVIEAEFDAPATTTEITSPELEPPKREEVFAVVMIGSRQYIVFPGRYIYTQRLKGANVDDKIILNKVLLVGTKTSTYIGKPVVPHAAVHAIVEEQGLDPKVVVFKYKKKKKYRRNIGHRQPNTRIRITGITGYQDSPAVTLDS